LTARWHFIFVRLRLRLSIFAQLAISPRRLFVLKTQSWKSRRSGTRLAPFSMVQEHTFMKRADTAIKLLTLAEAASILKISKRTLHRMIQHHQIPAFKVGGQWRILESRFQEWVQEEENTTTKAG
jgi:excisionase family DNA binding protein